MNLTPVSVLLPVKNGIQYWPNAEQTLLSYLRNKDEVVVVDDSSSDGSYEYALGLSRRVMNIKVLRNPGTGLVSALNYGLKHCSNDWVARHDIDDSYSMNRLTEQVKAIQSGTILIFSDYDVKTPTGRPLGTIPSAVTPSAMKISLITSQRTAHPSALFYKEEVFKAGSYRQEDFPAEDLSLWLRMSRLGDIRSVPISLLGYRLSPGSVSATRRSEMTKKTQHLHQEFALTRADIDSFLMDIEETFFQYDVTSLAQTRKLLAIHDVLSIQGGKGAFVRSLKLQFESFKLFTNPSTLSEIRRMLVERNARRVSRNQSAGE